MTFSATEEDRLIAPEMGALWREFSMPLQDTLSYWTRIDSTIHGEGAGVRYNQGVNEEVEVVGSMTPGRGKRRRCTRGRAHHDGSR